MDSPGYPMTLLLSHLLLDTLSPYTSIGERDGQKSGAVPERCESCLFLALWHGGTMPEGTVPTVFALRALSIRDLTFSQKTGPGDGVTDRVR